MTEINISAGSHSEDTPIWRYMDLPKFVWTLTTGCLWFTRLNRYEDPYEGFCKAWPLDLPSGDETPKVMEFHDGHETRQVSLPEMFSQISRISAEHYEAAPDRLYVNSWCLSDESMAMWEIYGSQARGIAVRSSVGQYRRAVKFEVPEDQYSLGQVIYEGNLAESPAVQLDFRLGTIYVPGPDLRKRTLKVAFRKRRCYEYEREWRAAIYPDDEPETGINVNVDLNELINAVYIGPRSEPFFFDTVTSVMEKYRLSKPLSISQLLCPPAKSTVVTP